MRTLRDIQVEQRWTSTKLAKEAKTSRPTLWKLYRKDAVNWQILYRVCKVLGISMDEYAKLDPCPESDKYRNESKRKPKS